MPIVLIGTYLQPDRQKYRLVDFRRPVIRDAVWSAAIL